MYRQGDILTRKAFQIPQDLVLVNRDELGRIVLAYGEATGHAHVIHDSNANLFHDVKNNKFYLMIVKQANDNTMSNTCDLIHEEHKLISIPPGNYLVKRQREYTPKEIVYVAD